MNSEQLDKSKLVGISQVTKDRFDIWSKSVAILGGILSIIALVWTLHVSNQQRAIDTAQRASELRWSQAKLAAELEDDMLIDDPQAFNALRMTDWDQYSFNTTDGNKLDISSEEVQEALKIENNLRLSPKGVFVRESFDRLFYRMGKIERALKSDLIREEDVRSPMDYYVQFLCNKYGQVLIPYMKQLHHTDALNLMKRFDTSAKCQ